MEKKPYRGPVFYFTHVPYLGEITKPEVQRSFANISKLTYSLKLAADLGIPIINEIGLTRDAKPFFDSLVRQMKTPPRIIEVNLTAEIIRRKMPDSKESDEAIVKDIIQKEKIEPTEFLFEGRETEMCVKRSIERIHSSFPFARLRLISGNYSVMGKGANRTLLKRDLERLGVKTSKKLSRGRLIRLIHRV